MINYCIICRKEISIGSQAISLRAGQFERSKWGLSFSTKSVQLGYAHYKCVDDK